MLEDLKAENAHLRTEVERVQSQQAGKLERMVTDLVKTKSELLGKDDRISGQDDIIEKQSTELQKLRGKVSNLSAELQDTNLAQNASHAHESANLKQSIGQLTTEIREKDLYMREKDQILREREFELRTVRGHLEQEQKQREKDAVEIQELQNQINSQDDTQMTMEETHSDIERSRMENLQQDLQDLKIAHSSALSQIDTGNAKAQQYLDELNQFRAAQDATRSAIDAERAKSQRYLQEIEQRNTAHRLLQSQIETGEAKARDLSNELNNLQASFHNTHAEMTNKLQAHERLQAAHASKLAEARRLGNFFKKNSEATTRKVKMLEAEIQNLKLAPHRHHEGQEDDGVGVEMQGGASEPPGAWPGLDRSAPSLRRKPISVSNMA